MDTLHNAAIIDAEKSVIGGILIDHKRCEYAFELLAEECFSDEINRQIFGVLLELRRKKANIEPTIVLEALGGEGWAKVYLLECAQLLPSMVNYDSYVEIVRNSWRKSMIQHALIGIIEESYLTPSKAVDLTEKLRKILQDNDALNAEERLEYGSSFENVAGEFVKTLDEINDSFRTGYRDFDNIIGGFRRGSIAAIAARSGQGKTAFAINLLMRFAAKSYKVVYCSMEMPNIQLMERIASLGCKIDGTRIRDKIMTLDEKKSVRKICGMLKGYEKIKFVDEIIGTSSVRKIADIEKPDIIIIDHLGIMKLNERLKNNYEKIGEASKELKRLALEKNIAIIELVQMNRNVEKRLDKEPQLSDIRDCGNIEQDADYVVFLATIIPDKPLKGDEWTESKAYVRKNRHGRCGVKTFKFRTQYQEFEEYRTDSMYDPIPFSKPSDAVDHGDFEEII